MRVTLTHFVFQSKGGERETPHGLAIPEGAEKPNWNPETLTLTVEVPNEGGEPTEHEFTVTQEAIDEAEAAANAPAPVDVAALISALWEDFNRHALEQTDINSRSSISLIISNPDSTAQQIQRATDWGNWWAAHWTLYGQKRAEIVETESPVEYAFTDAPWTIWEISA